jgi:hypothetical protein
VPEQIDQPMTPANILRLYAATAVALTRWEDRLRLVSLAISEKRGDEADQLDIVLDDADGLLAIPPEARACWSCWGETGARRGPGLVHKGSFKVDEVNHSGPPDQIRIRARAADFTSAIRNRREQSWANTTLGTVLQDIAGRNALSLRIAPDLAAIALPALHQSRESDTAFLRRLGRENDAVATIKTGTLIFARKGAGTTSTGQPCRPSRSPAAAAMAIHGSARRATGRPVSPPTGTTARPPATAPSPWARPKAQKPCARPTPTKPAPAAPPPPNTPASNAPRHPRHAPRPGPPRRHPRSPRHPHRLQARNRHHPMADHRVTHRLDNAGGFITELKMETAG